LRLIDRSTAGVFFSLSGTRTSYSTVRHQEWLTRASRRDIRDAGFQPEIIGVGSSAQGDASEIIGRQSVMAVTGDQISEVLLSALTPTRVSSGGGDFIDADR